jgi:hypothetical protein
MKLGGMIILFNIAIAGILGFHNNCNAIWFGNMGGSGGKKAVEAQKASSRASSKFLKAAAATFEMFSLIELNVSSERPSLNESKRRGVTSLELLQSALREFQSIKEMKRALAAASEDVRKQHNYEVIFGEAAFSLETEIQQKFIEISRKEEAAGLLDLCIRSIEDLISPKTPMGKVYEDIVVKGEIPKAQILWAAAEQWNRAFQTGRVVSSFFTVR